MRKYLAPNDTHKITIPLVVGAEYAVPAGDGKLTLRVSGVDTTSVVPSTDTSEVEVEIQTPNVPAGQVRIINCLFTMPTNIGRLQWRENFGVVDLLDVPATSSDVRNLLGLTEEELEDDSIDHIEHYLKYYSTLKPDFHTQRVSNEYLTKRFGDLIAISTSLDILPTLITRLDKKRVTENGEITRLGTAQDLLDLKESLEAQLAEILDDLADYLDQEVLALTPAFQFVSMYQHSIGI